MAEILGILGAGLLFVLFALVSRERRRSCGSGGSGGCGIGACGGCASGSRDVEEHAIGVEGAGRKGEAHHDPR